MAEEERWCAVRRVSAAEVAELGRPEHEELVVAAAEVVEEVRFSPPAWKVSAAAVVVVEEAAAAAQIQVSVAGAAAP